MKLIEFKSVKVGIIFFIFLSFLSWRINGTLYYYKCVQLGIAGKSLEIIEKSESLIYDKEFVLHIFFSRIVVYGIPPYIVVRKAKGNYFLNSFIASTICIFMAIIFKYAVGSDMLNTREMLFSFGVGLIVGFVASFYKKKQHS